MQPIIELQNKMRAELGKPKFEFTPVLSDPTVEAAAAAWLGDRVRDAIAKNPGKEAQYKALADAKAALLAALGETHEPKALAHAFESIEKKVVRERILGDKIRPDGRDHKEIRPISVEVGILPRVHGSGLFTRGETQVLTVATLGTPGDAQKLDTLNAEESKRYMHHYNFPPFSTGEVAPMPRPQAPRDRARRAGRAGAGADDPGAGELPVHAAPGLRGAVVQRLHLDGIGVRQHPGADGRRRADQGAGGRHRHGPDHRRRGDQRRACATPILSDIQGLEDHLGDMDFKVAGTEHGITALQMDIKIHGLTYEILEEALAQAREGRLFIMGKMLAVLPEPRKNLSDYAPRILTMHIDPEKIGKVIGPGGKMIRGLQETVRRQDRHRG